ncbi:MAG: dTMP kinase [Thermomicrobiales bacterium]|nr:dTMP kinase [Thermomicrobiales bacterium]MCO5221262.1 dTMP kinase [Thermomicrobiales bacterium]
MRRGEFIAFEGIDGSGKSTQSRALADRIGAAGRTVVLTREPGGTPVGEAIRAMLFDRELGNFEPRTEALLHSAARAQHVAELIAPAIERGVVVITDRFIDSTLAYQGGGNHLSLVDLESIQSFAVQDTYPDLRILIDVPPETGLARRLADAASVNRIDEAGLMYHSRVAETFRQLAAVHPERWFVVDGSLPQEQITTLIVEAVRNRFGSMSDI